MALRQNNVLYRAEMRWDEFSYNAIFERQLLRLKMEINFVIQFMPPFCETKVCEN